MFHEIEYDTAKVDDGNEDGYVGDKQRQELEIRLSECVPITTGHSLSEYRICPFPRRSPRIMDCLAPLPDCENREKNHSSGGKGNG